jgi:hypothetical protein
MKKLEGSYRRHESLPLILYNDQRNAHIFNLFTYLLLPYMFLVFF